MRHLPAWTSRWEQLVLTRLTVATAGLLAVGLAAAGVPTAASATATATATPHGPVLVRSVRDTPPTVFEGRAVRGRAGVEASALDLAAAVGGVPVAPRTWGPWVRAGDLAVAPDRCPRTELEVSWRPPGDGYTDGAYVAPLGPPPSDATRRVNGVVLCRSSHEAFLGFEATWDGGRWLLSAVPSLDESASGDLLAGEADAAGATPAPPAPAATADGTPPTLPSATAWADAELEPLADYVPQSTCDPTAKPGVLGFRDLLLAAYPGTRNLGIGRVCEADGVSEHKEGRAFDWGVRADDPVERAEAEQVLAWLLAPDAAGEPHAMARRLGLMYVIWDGHIWSSFLADEGWRPYVGRSEHRDHVHLSFSWDGALARTSFWQGGRALLPGAGLGGPAPSGSDGEQPPPPTTTTSTTTSTTSPPPTTAPPSTTTTTTRPVAPPPTLPSPPTTLGLGSL
jgi:hypothetical protein